MKTKTTKEKTMQTLTEVSKTKVEVKSTKLELKDINDTLLDLYNAPGMALQFQPSNLKILKKQIERLIVLEEMLYGRDKPIQTTDGIKI
jgi:hypothetical protein